MKKSLTLSCFLVLFFNPAFSQRSVWQHIYPDGGNMKQFQAVQSTYDNGIVIAATYLTNSTSPYIYESWITKTDINGNIIWSKYYYDPNYTFFINDMEAEPNGDIMITGQTSQWGDYDAMVMKLNACGEKQWCSYLPFNGGYGYHIKKLSGERYLLQTCYASNDWTVEPLQFWFLDSLGRETYCKQILPNDQYPFLNSPFITGIDNTSDHGFLLSGSVFFPLDTNNLNGWFWRQQMLVKTDSMGNEQWGWPTSLDTNRIGDLLGSIEYNNACYSAGFKWPGFYGDSKCPYFRKTTMDGTVLIEKQLHPDTLWSIICGIRQIDANLIMPAEVSLDTGNLWFTEVYKTDTAGNIIKTMRNTYGQVGEHSEFTMARDQKFLLGGFAPYDAPISLRIPWLMKINKELEYDSVYTYPFVYDSLCNDPLPVQTYSDCSCDVLIGIDGPVKWNTENELKVYPNPANEKVMIMFGEVPKAARSGDPELVTIVNSWGTEVERLQFNMQKEINIYRLSPGIYVVTLLKGNSVLGRKKLVVYH